MRRLRDIDLWELVGSRAGEDILYAQPISYILCCQLKRYKIQVADIAKINIHPSFDPAPYVGSIWDGVTDIDIYGNLAEIVKKDSASRNLALLQCFADGVRGVLDYFRVPTEALELMCISIAKSGFVVTQHLGSADAIGVRAKVVMNWDGEQNHCTISVCVKMKGLREFSLPLCTHFPFLDALREKFLGAHFDSQGWLYVEFKCFDGEMRKSGRRAFEPLSNMVHRSHDTVRSIATLRANINALRSQIATE